MKIISVDDHIVEHHTVWTDRLPVRYREVGPHVVRDGSRESWVYEDMVLPFVTGISATVGRRSDEWSMEAVRLDEIRPGSYDPAARLDDMDQDGVWAQLCFGSFPRFAGIRFIDGKDKELALLCVRAYNDFILNEWCAVAPDRYIPLGILPMWDSDLAAREVEALAEQGFKSATFPENPEPLGLPSWHTGYWDPVFAAAQAADIPLSIHIGTSQRPAPVSSDALGKMNGASPAGIALMAVPTMALVVDLIFSKVFEKFPNLKIAMSEGGIGWVPYILERLDQTWEAQRGWGQMPDARPSEVFPQHFFGCFIRDDFGIENRYKIGIDNIMVESDYPHSDSPWPDTRKYVEEALADAPDDETHKIVELNARTLFNFHAG